MCGDNMANPKFQWLFSVLSLKWVVPVILLLVLALAGWGGISAMRARLAAQIYARRLASVTEEYLSLREQYNQAVMKTAVTELLVAGGRVSVRVRTSLGVVKVVPTDCNPDHEVYVDYIIHDGRLWIRRVFDSSTAPSAATVIDPAWANLDWDDENLEHGKAVYRRLEDGCWVVTVTGNGALGLVRVESPLPDEALSAPPPVKDFQKAVAAAASEAEAISFLDVLRHLAGKSR